MDSRNAESAGSDRLTVMEYAESGMSEFIVCDIVGCVVGFFLKTVGDDFAWKILRDLLVFRSICVDDECTVCRKKFCKLTERMTDVIDILEEIQMIRIHVQDDADLREKAQEAVGVLAGFGEESL